MTPRFVYPGLLVLAALLPGGFAAQAQESPAPAIPATDRKDATAFQVLRIIDGDTVVIEQDGKPVKVRLIGVDTPETVHPNRPVEEYGREAARFTTNLLKGESVYLEYDRQKTDRYGRTLAYLYRAPDGLFVNLEIVRQGYGHAYTKYPFKYMDRFRASERKAREAGRGLWGSAAPVEGKDTQPAKRDCDQPDEETTVYITKTGRKYHAEGCEFLSKSKIAIPLDEARAKYDPCSVCHPPK